MLFSTPTQFAVLVLLLVAGWLFGLASHPGGGKWRDRYAAERDAHAAAQKNADAQIAATRSAEARTAELERENARLRAAPVAVPVADPVYRDDPRATRIRAVRPAYTGEKRGWFDWDTRPATFR